MAAVQSICKSVIREQMVYDSIEDEDIVEFHKKKSQPTPNQMKSRFLITHYDSRAALDENTELEPITSSISSSIRLSSHVEMDNLTTSATRKYYQSIVNDARTTYDQKKLKIYFDLVIGSRSQLHSKKNAKKRKMNMAHSEFILNYKIGKESDTIYTTKGCALTVGRYKECDICTGYQDLTISRIQCFILVIDDSLIILDGWSYDGTNTIQVNDNKHNLQNSTPNKRYILRFNKNDTIHLRFGESNVDLIINPKPCIVCMDKSRVIRNECGHLICCYSCYDDIISNQDSKSLCPICRAPLNKLLKNKNNLNDEDMIQSFCKPSILE